ncbi:MAG: metallophosphoesterase [Eubacteriaceae bacterium]|nr:metallophosphoesterase [Eubacteriaceae bacterium]
MKNSKYIYSALWGMALCATVCFAVRSKIKIVLYRIRTDKVKKKVRLALITDLHNRDYGAKKNELLIKTMKMNPDAVLLGGDIFDNRGEIVNSWELLRALGARYPLIFVSGNHERVSEKSETIEKIIKELGIIELKGEGICLNNSGEKIVICGVEDKSFGREKFLDQLIHCTEMKGEETFNILLSHHPEAVKYYKAAGFDLVLCGHTHGGQWRLPGLINGFFAPNQGFFPKYGGGYYNLGETKMVVSRGLANTTPLPRIFNPPELVMVDIMPEKGDN